MCKGVKKPIYHFPITYIKPKTSVYDILKMLN